MSDLPHISLISSDKLIIHFKISVWAQYFVQANYRRFSTLNINSYFDGKILF